MSNINKATGAAGQLAVGDKTILMSRLRVRDTAQWEQWILKKLKDAPNPFERIKEQTRHLRAEDKRIVLKIAYDNAYSMDSLDSPQAKRIMDSMESRAFMVWLSARKEQPDVALEEISEAILDMTNLELADLVEAISGMGVKPKGKEESNGEAAETDPTG